ncbi:MAG: hypothetical protein LBD99_01930 [Candidatus Margulisbacteria bacterium]|jgi:hypothetical protein|nr:hypothetical protein [Candidatus Margulisiibacteriota bacterium]
MFKKVISQGSLIRLAAHSGAGSLLREVWVQEKKNGFLLSGIFQKRSISVEGHTFYLNYSPGRHDRHNIKMLEERGILNPNVPEYYTKDHPNSRRKIALVPAAEIAPEDRTKFKRALFANVLERNPGEQVLELEISGFKGRPQKFYIGANYAPVSPYHFVAWMPPAIDRGFLTATRQVYQGINLLYYADNLLQAIGDPELRIFFSAQGGGNSSDMLHFQITGAKYPAFASTSYHHPYFREGLGLFYISRTAWVFPGLLARYNDETRDKYLPKTTTWIKNWLEKNPASNTFNLLGQLRPDGIRELFFVKRKTGRDYIRESKYDLAGYEISGNFVVETLEEYENFPRKIPRLEWDLRRGGQS